VGATLIAAEPVAGMRTLLAAALAFVPTTGATAEALPLRVGSLDAIVVAQAFHWFDASAALAEFHRVLRPGGRIGLIWNFRDRSVPWVDELWSIMDSVEKRTPWRDHFDWRESAFAETPWFTPPREATFHHEQVLTPDEMVDRVRSVSHVAVLPSDRQRVVLDQVRAVLRAHPATAGKDLVAFPYRVDAYWAERH